MELRHHEAGLRRGSLQLFREANLAASKVVGSTHQHLELVHNDWPAESVWAHDCTRGSPAAGRRFRDQQQQQQQAGPVGSKTDEEIRGARIGQHNKRTMKKHLPKCCQQKHLTRTAREPVIQGLSLHCFLHRLFMWDVVCLCLCVFRLEWPFRSTLTSILTH